MIDSTNEYKEAIVGDVRKMVVKAIIDISDPDMIFGSVNSSGEEYFSKPEQLRDKNTELTNKYVTLEHGRWILDGTFKLINEDYDLTGSVGFVGDYLSDEDGYFDNAVFVEQTFSNVSILQACSIYFSSFDFDGVPRDFKVSVYSGQNEAYYEEFENNSEKSVSVSGFTVYNPTSVRITVTRWSLPSRRMRIAEIIPGVYENWSGDVFASVSLVQRGNFSCLSLPYGTCNIRMDNIDRRFEPRNKSGVFKSIQERQAIPVSIGCELPNGSVEYKNAGVYFQSNGGWKTGDNSITMEWKLVDIIGLLSSREYTAPQTLPTTLSDWIASVVSVLGDNFASWYSVDSEYSNKNVFVNNRSDVDGKKCADIIRWVCMATETWPRADAETGYLTVEPLWNQGNKVVLDNLSSYPVMEANEEIAVLTFKIFGSRSDTTINISGNSTSSSKSLTVSNPFIHTEEQARIAARQILSQYGGIKIQTVGRGDPSSEIGDVDTVWLDESSATTGRRMEQNISFSNGVMKNCKSVLLQSDGSFMYENKAVFTENGTFTPEQGVERLRLILVGKGEDGTDGEDGTYVKNGADGINGLGGLVWSETVEINAGQTYNITIGENSTFGIYSSAAGSNYQYGFTDIKSGDVYARTGVKVPVDGTGDGGRMGLGGAMGRKHIEGTYDDDGNYEGLNTVIDVRPKKGTKGVKGALGCVVVYWEKG